MLNDADISRFRHVYVFVGKTDIRKGIDSISTLIKQKFQLNPFQTENLFLFCGSSNRKTKGLLWEEDSFLLLYKWLEASVFQWPGLEAEAQGHYCRAVSSAYDWICHRSVRSIPSKLLVKTENFCLPLRTLVYVLPFTQHLQIV